MVHTISSIRTLVGSKSAIRKFATTPPNNKAACSLVQPVHHLIKIDKSKLTTRFDGLKFDKDDIRSPAYKPKDTRQDRLKEHYLNTLQSDILLINYKHNATVEKGLKNREWDGTSPYQINRPMRKPKGSNSELPDTHPIKWNNIPGLKSMTLNCYVREARDNEMLTISAALQLQQLTGCKPKIIYSKSDVPNWKIRKGHAMGAKVTLEGYEMSQFLNTLSEIVLPRIREYKGINMSSGDRFGGIAFGLDEEEVKFFPEIDLNQDLWPKTFGMHINVNTTAQTNEQARTLVSSLQIPFNTENEQRM
ncbi:similar to Saccharomyces cerevisiae YDR237W MRPL7 Mitochondrial ribosomal protein of the large subunit [Maudiozyma barnettii]|uniref:Large ribosomal subunit protein uL5m n=1 Tax=Maudiozyma barnettii TaxID=61262 RepID=A0A8H2ZHQ7_9SACH|nr:mitochondrial 54S ribosomal protein YmL7/YmL5 [Kazachstania barnettii]CAB4255038.1 similar to Saccharomyces cerevisiae YDR237W MRPL7 Mitochondrial ribosomal protein of the large subunit [Kazachstania barnettii]CAD1783309.1 similar to Saccharomyces cerevisiae YDR237W MRPL7 Mitochondrial ribosomal protein of the large subunit [Kazachstania barnettii]